MERKWGICVFGDIRGFGRWTSRAANSPEVKEPFIQKFYTLMDRFIVKHRDIYFKRVGDGFMVFKEFKSEGDGRKIADFIGIIRCLTRKARSDVNKGLWPTPGGFRVRITSGDVFKILVVDENDPERKRIHPEYIEYPTNAAAHLLVVNPDQFCLVTEGVIEALGQFRSMFKIKRLKIPSCYPESVNKEDVDGLYILRL